MNTESHHVSAVLDMDPTFHFKADPDPDLASHQSDANLRPLVYRLGSETLSSAIIKSLICFLLRLIAEEDYSDLWRVPMSIGAPRKAVTMNTFVN